MLTAGFEAGLTGNELRVILVRNLYFSENDVMSEKMAVDVNFQLK
jgi:hypothetical protein